MAWSEGQRPLGTALHLSDEPSVRALESVVSPCYRAMEIVVVIIIIKEETQIQTTKSNKITLTLV